MRHVVNNKILSTVKEWGYKQAEKERAGAVFDWTPEIARQFRNEFENDLENILDNPYFLNLGDSLYPLHREDILAIYEEKKKRNISLVILLEGIGSGKSTVASVLTWLEHFNLTTLYNPQKFYNMMEDEIIAFITMNRSETQARRVTLQKILPKFQTQFNLEYFPPNKRRGQEIWIPRNNTLIFGGTSNAASALGYNIKGGVVDEANFLEVIEGGKKGQSVTDTYDAAEEMHNAMFNRMTSRFISPINGKLDGTLIMISSSRYPNDFLEKKAREHFKLGANSHIFVRRRTTWEAKPKHYLSGVKFQFDLGAKKVINTSEEIEGLKLQGQEIMMQRAVESGKLKQVETV